MEIIETVGKTRDKRYFLDLSESELLAIAVSVIGVGQEDYNKYAKLYNVNCPAWHNTWDIAEDFENMLETR